MKKIAGFLIFTMAFGCVFAQEKLTNQEDSKYEFKKIAHLDATPVQSQGRTGTCWSFSALSFFESEVTRMGKPETTLSEMYIVYNTYLGKADKFIRTDGHTNFSEGGAFHDIPWVIKRKGIVPASVYSGLNYGTETHTHAELYEVLNGATEGVLKSTKNLRGSAALSSSWQNALRGILNAYLGPIPEKVEEFEFTADGAKYNPITYRDHLGLNMDDYVSITSFSNHPYNEKCFLAIADNWAWGESYNVTLEDLWAVAENSLKTGYTFAWASDVSEDYFDFRSGLAVVPEDKSTIQVRGQNNKNFSDAGAEKIASCFMEPVKEQVITQEIRQAGYDNKQTTDDHGMHAVGLYQDQNKTDYLLIKNSWGTGNHCDGYLYVSKAFFDYKTINIYVHKDALPKELRKKLGL
ncbi:C1 family peptidase [Crocinitomix catalasitica]|uniref:aminopeptidase C n=1 Tax=Crocinitomix catalasitica TaxID=184607 RepID=UPI000488E4D7|nr:C1 family peptidase [Crocinitomix catalasitica]